MKHWPDPYNLADPNGGGIAPAAPAPKIGQGWYLRSTPTNMGFNPLRARFTLGGGQLLIEPERHGGTLLKDTLGALGALEPVAFPLRRISQVLIHERKVWGKRDLLRIAFDNGGREYIWLQPADEWREALLAARATAPELPFTTPPPLKHGVESSVATNVGTVMLVVLAVVVALMLVCVALGAALT